jgi:alpha-glucosidase
MTMPGVPVVFMGDELGLTAVDGEHARTPYPWERPDTWDRVTFDAYCEWIGLRHRHVALRRGGLRWLHASGETMTFLREHPDQTLLVHANRSATTPVTLPLGAFDPGLTCLDPLTGPPAGLTDREVILPGATPGVAVYVVDGR